MSINRYAAKRDDNEAAILDALRDCGATVYQLDRPCDAVIGFRGANFLIEIKQAKGKLTPGQSEFFETWNGQVAVVRTVDDALRVIGAVE